MNGRVITVTMNPSVDKTITLKEINLNGLNRPESIRSDPGGKGINVGRMLHGFNIDVTATGIIAGGQGAYLLEMLNQEGLNTELIESEGETRTNLKILDQSTNQITEINEPGCMARKESVQRVLEKLDQLSERAEIIVLSGSLPPGVPSDFYGQCIGIAKNRGAKAILDADGNAFSEGLNAVPYAVKPNLHELELFYGSKFDSLKEIANAAMDIVSGGVETAVISLGAEGAIVANQSEIYRTVCRDVPVHSTVGAGDAMVGALVYSILKQSSLFETARFITAAAAAAVTKSGTRFCTLQEVLDLLEKVEITSQIV